MTSTPNGSPPCSTWSKPIATSWKTHARKSSSPAGTSCFVRAPDLGVIGTCALQKTGAAEFELTKIGVRAAARGRKVGEFLLRAILWRARELQAEKLYLLTNSLCAPAIHLYEKVGFRHDADIMREFGARYRRCDVAMRHTAVSQQDYRL